MTKTIHGTVYGKTIELNEDLGVAEGQEVEIQVKLVVKSNRIPGEGFARTEGALAEDTEWDEIMDEIHQARKLERRPQSLDLGEA
jgi:hypothetical protein